MKTSHATFTSAKHGRVFAHGVVSINDAGEIHFRGEDLTLDNSTLVQLEGTELLLDDGTKLTVTAIEPQGYRTWGVKTEAK
jgi:hypothetical protein